MKNSDNNRGKAVLLVLSMAAVASLVVGYVRNNAFSGHLKALHGRQVKLERCRDLAAEYQSLRKQQVDPRGRDRYVRTLMEKISRELGIQGALKRINESEIQRTSAFVEIKYSAELRAVSMKDVAMFLYRIQTSGKNLIPAEIIMRRHKESGRWTAHLAVHAVSALE